MILTFGEIMLRLAPPGYARFRQSLPGSLTACFGGGESNVAVSLALLGDPVAYCTALPDQPITQCLLDEIRGYGVDVSRIQCMDHGRLGIYFLETGSNQRPSVVVYDREGSCMSIAGPEQYDFDSLLQGISWVHTTGITPALGRPAADATLALCQAAHERNIPVSLDLNFRKKLWKWDTTQTPKNLARSVMAQILPHVSLVIANEADAGDILDIHARDTAVDQGQVDAAAYLDVARTIAKQYPQVQQVAITLRESYSANHNNWGGLLYEHASDSGFFAPLDADGRYAPYELRNIVDRVGGGDSFGAGLIHALRSPTLSAPQDAIRFAVAASALKHTIPGDFNLSSEQEVYQLMNGTGSGRVQR